MSSGHFIFSLLIPLLLLTSAPAEGQFVCPTPTAIAPCQCLFYPPSLTGIICDDPSVTQENVNKVLSLVRQVNHLNTTDLLYLTQFILENTQMTQLDFTPFLGSTVGILDIKYNPHLEKIFLPSSAPKELGFVTGEAHLWENNFTDSAECVKVILELAGEHLGKLDIADNHLHGVVDGPFLGGLEHLTNLKTLNLERNGITYVGGSQFRTNNKLNYLILSENNITGLGANAFDFESTGQGQDDLIIYLGENNLTDSGVESGSVFGVSTRPTTISFEYNFFDTLSQEKFERIMTANEDNFLFFGHNQIFCAPNMKWLKDGREIFEYHVTGLNCVNDEGKTIFTTDLV